jgi:homoserine acetyltransferase
MPEDYQTYKLGTFSLKSGGEIPDAFIAYKTLGDPSLPAIIYPTWYSGCNTAMQSFIILANLEQQFPTISGSPGQTRH